MLSDYGWQIKIWKLEDKEKRDNWIENNKNNFQIREIFVNNKLAIEYKKMLKF